MIKPLRLLVLTPEYRGYGGGIGAYYRALLPALVRANCTVRVIEGSAHTSAGHSDQVLVDGVSVETLEAKRLHEWEPRLPALGATPFLRRSVAASWAMWEQAGFGERIDVIEATDFGLGFIAPLVGSSLPLIMQMHGSQGQIAHHDPLNSQRLDGVLALALETSLALCAAEVQSPSVANAGYWAAQTQRNVVCRRPAWKRGLDVDPGPRSGRLSVFGRVQRWKGPHILCEALRLLGNGAPEVDWYGRDTPFESSNHTCSNWLRAAYPDIWGTKITWHPQVPQAQVAEIQSRSLFNVIPSTWDVFNFTVVEAMASGRPVICSSAAGASELISNGTTGFVYPDNSPTELANAISKALSLRHQEQDEMGIAARRSATRCLDPEAVAAERLQAYRLAVTEHCQQTRPVIPDWVRRISVPVGLENNPTYAFLDQHSLRTITKYVAERIASKIVGITRRTGAV